MSLECSGYLLILVVWRIILCGGISIPGSTRLLSNGLLAFVRTVSDGNMAGHLTTSVNGPRPSGERMMSLSTSTFHNELVSGATYLRYLVSKVH